MDDDIFQDLFGAPAAEPAKDKRPRVDESDDEDVVFKRKKRVVEEPAAPAEALADEMDDFIVKDADGEQDRDEIVSAGLGSASSSYDSDSSEDSGSSEDDRAPKVRTHMDEVLNRLKKTRRAKGVEGVDKADTMEQLVTSMMRAASDDTHAIEEGRPGLHKIALLQQVEDYVLKQPWQEPFIDAGGLRAFHDWLRLLPDGSLPNLTLRSTVLRLIERLQPSITIELLKESKVGWAVNDAYHHPKETSDNRRIEFNLIAAWLQALSRSRGESSAPTKASKEDMDAARQRQKKPVGREQISRSAVSGDFRVQPVSKVEPLEKREDADTALGRLKKKIV